MSYSRALVGPVPPPSGRLGSVIEQLLEADRQLQVDQVDRARGIYQRVFELDPGNAIAVVGLAECALADGDDLEAYRLASEALTIDPQNDKARRMEARLSEIMSVRGEPVERPAVASTPADKEMRPVVTEAAPEEEPETTPTTVPTAEPEAPARSAPPAPASSTRNPMRKSLFDRLMGR